MVWKCLVCQALIWMWDKWSTSNSPKALFRPSMPKYWERNIVDFWMFFLLDSKSWIHGMYVEWSGAIRVLQNLVRSQKYWKILKESVIWIYWVCLKAFHQHPLWSPLLFWYQLFTLFLGRWFYMYIVPLHSNTVPWFTAVLPPRDSISRNYWLNTPS